MLKEIEQFLSLSIYSSTNQDVKISIGGVLFFIFILIVTRIVLSFIRKLVTRHLNTSDKPRFNTVFMFLKYTVFTFIIVTSLDASGIKITALLAASAALFVGIGLSMQKLYQDIVSGIFILIDKTIKAGDIIKIEDKIGKVTQVGLRTTRVITKDNKNLLIPNHKFLTDILYNWTQNDNTTRHSVKVGVAYGSDVHKVESLLLEAASQEPSILSEPFPKVHFQDFGDSALQFKVHFYVEDSFNVKLIKSDLRYKIHKIFNEHHINIPFPQQDIHIISK